MTEQPSTGGSYIRLKDGTLKRVEAEVPKVDAPKPRRSAGDNKPEK